MDLSSQAGQDTCCLRHWVQDTWQLSSWGASTLQQPGASGHDFAVLELSSSQELVKRLHATGTSITSLSILFKGIFSNAKALENGLDAVVKLIAGCDQE